MIREMEQWGKAEKIGIVQSGKALGSPNCDFSVHEGATRNVERDFGQGMEGQGTTRVAPRLHPPARKHLE